MKFFDQFNLAQKIVLVLTALALMLFLFVESGNYRILFYDEFYFNWGELLADVFGIVLAGIVVTAAIGIVRGELAKRMREPNDADESE